MNEHEHLINEHDVMADSKIQIFDNKICKAPPLYDGSVEKWRSWSLKIRSYTGGLSTKLHKMVKIVQGYPSKIDSHDSWEPEQIQLDFTMYQLMTTFLEGDALDVLESVEEGFGLEVRRQLPKDTTGRD